MPGYGKEKKKKKKWVGTTIEETWSTASKIATCVAIAHLYTILCSIVYQALDGSASDDRDLVEDFLRRTFQRDDIVTLKSSSGGAFAQFMVDYRQVVQEQTQRIRRYDFRSLAKCYTFALTVHSTVGNSGLTLMTWQSKMFFVFSAPLGVLSYYLMLHFISVEFVVVLRTAAVSTFRYTRRGWSEHRQNLFVKFKILLLPFLLSGLLILVLSTIALAVGETYLSGLHLMVDTYLTSGTSNYLRSFVEWDDSTAALAATLYIFTVLVFFYTTMLATVNAFWGQNWMEIWNVICTGRDVESGYSPLPQGDECSSDSRRKTTKFLYESGLYGEPLAVKDKCNQTAYFSDSSSDVQTASSRGRSNKLGSPSKRTFGRRSNGSSREVTPFESSLDASDFEAEATPRAVKARPTPLPIDMEEVSRRLQEQEHLPKIHVTMATPIGERFPTTLFPSANAVLGGALVELDEVEAEASIPSIEDKPNVQLNSGLSDSGQANLASVARLTDEATPPGSEAVSITGALPAGATSLSRFPNSSAPASPVARSVPGAPWSTSGTYLEDYDQILSHAGSTSLKETEASAEQTLRSSESKGSLGSYYSDISLSEISGL